MKRPTFSQMKRNWRESWKAAVAGWLASGTVGTIWIKLGAPGPGILPGMSAFVIVLFMVQWWQKRRASAVSG